MKKKRFIALWVLLFLLATGMIYNIYDNGRVVVAKQDITLNRLPEAFEGYRILQISDLHGKYFGKDQGRLLAAIHSLDYDCVLLTGDMNKYAESDETSSGAVFALLNGLGSDKPVYWVDGNTGPFAVENLGGSCTGELTSVGKEIEEKGVRVLLEPAEIERNGQRIWFVPPLDKPEIDLNYSDVPEERFENHEQYEKVLAYGEQLQGWYDELNHNGDVKIRVNHYPMQVNLSEEEMESLGYLDYSLSIAGHYHGGQWRIPFYGALYIPSPTAGTNNGYFPDQKEVKGLIRFGEMQQYVSAGLGASANIALLGFRLFDTPEINLITLHGAR